MPVSIDNFLRAHGFRAHPFATMNAEVEREQLPAFFVPGGTFEWLLGTSAQPQTLILFGPQGFGKSSYRIELARQLTQRREMAALVVTINDFAPLMRHGVEAVTLENHIALIRRLTLEALAAQVDQSVVCQSQLAASPALAAQLFGLLQLFAPRRVIGRVLPPNAERYAEAVEAEGLGPREWLRELGELARTFGYSCIYCLYDGLDELRELRDNPDVMLRLLGPLLDAPGLLDEGPFVFRFFIPHDIADIMKSQQVGRLDRILHRVLSWSEDELLQMLSRRLGSYSRGAGASSLSQVTRLSDLCQAPYNLEQSIDRALVQAAEASPRRLVKLCHDLFERHCSAAMLPQDLISAVTVAALLQTNAPSLAGAVPVLPSAAQAQTTGTVGGLPQSVNGAVPLLHLDDWGYIWLGERRLDAPIGGMTRRCLEHLWKNRHKRIDYDELIEALYGNDMKGRGDPRGSMEKLVKRLRELLEPGTTSSHTYIKTQLGSGYVLQHFRDQR